MGFDVLFKVLRPLECLAAKFAFMRLQWYMNPDVRGNVITLDSRSSTSAPLACQVQVIGAFATNMSVANMILETPSAH